MSYWSLLANPPNPPFRILGSGEFEGELNPMLKGGLTDCLRGTWRYFRWKLSKWMTRLDKWDGETRPPCVSDIRCSRLQQHVGVGGGGGGGGVGGGGGGQEVDERLQRKASHVSKTKEKKLVESRQSKMAAVAAAARPPSSPASSSSPISSSSATSFRLRWSSFSSAARHSFLSVVEDASALECPANLDLLVLTLSSLDRLDERLAIRETWASLKEVHGFRIANYFLLGKPTKKQVG